MMVSKCPHKLTYFLVDNYVMKINQNKLMQAFMFHVIQYFLEGSLHTRKI